MTLIIFDVDGTLVYSNKVDSQCFAATYKQLYGLEFPSIDWESYPHVTDTSIFSTVIQEQFGREVKAGEIEHFTDHFVNSLKQMREEEPEHFRMVPGAREAVHSLLESEEHIVGIATGGWVKPARFKLQHVGIREEQIFFSGADGKITRESIMEEVMTSVQQAKLEYNRVVYIGDAIWDVRTTRNMQMDFVGIRWKNDVDYLMKAGATQVINDYRDFNLFLEAVAKASPPDRSNNFQIL